MSRPCQNQQRRIRMSCETGCSLDWKGTQYFPGEWRSSPKTEIQAIQPEVARPRLGSNFPTHPTSGPNLRHHLPPWGPGTSFHLTPHAQPPPPAPLLPRPADKITQWTTGKRYPLRNPRTSTCRMPSAWPNKHLLTHQSCGLSGWGPPPNLINPLGRLAALTTVED